MGEFVPLDAAALAGKLSFADEAAEVHKQSARRQWEAAYGPAGANGIKSAVLSSDAETGWAFCIHHGQMPTVNPKSGERDYNGVCQACYRASHSPEAIASRKEEVAQQLAAEEAAVRAEAARIEAMDRGPMDVPGPEVALADVVAEPPAVDASAGEAARGLETGPPGAGSAATFHVEQSVPGVGPRDDARPDGEARAPDWAWLAGLEDDGDR